jgi:hypothetical protein
VSIACRQLRAGLGVQDVDTGLTNTYQALSIVVKQIKPFKALNTARQRDEQWVTKVTSSTAEPGFASDAGPVYRCEGICGLNNPTI